MKALTLWQPFASLIACGIKHIETRSWAPPADMQWRRIAIHAAKRKVDWEALTRQGVTVTGNPSEVDLPRGAVVCTAVLYQVSQVVANDGDRAYLGGGPVDAHVKVDAYGDYSVGRWLWFFSDVQPVEPPIPARGRQKLWEWNDD